MVPTRPVLLRLVALLISAQLATLTMASVDDAFAAAVREKRVPGIAAIALNRDGSVIYKNSWGTVNIDDPSSAPITSTTKMAIASMTKAVVSIAALQLFEQGKFSLDDLVEDYIPSWKNMSVLDGFTADGEPILRAPRTKATVLQLFTHSAGPGYAFLHEDIQQYSLWLGKQPTIPEDPLNPDPLASDPGTGWFYGTSIDYLGNIVEHISGLRLDAYIEQNIFKPLGIKNSGLINPDIHFHRRHSNGTITAAPPGVVDPSSTPFGGGYLISTLDDYSTFLLTLINWGTHPTTGASILRPSTVKKYVFTDLTPRTITGDGTCNFTQKGAPIGVWNSVNLTQSLSTEILPGTPKGWSASFLTNNEKVKGRRSKGSGTWAGIFNLYYWVDLEAGKLGVVFTNLMPFMDPTVLGLFDKLEEFVYKK